MKSLIHMEVVKVICYDIQPLIVEGIKLAANANTMIDFIGGYDCEDQFINKINSTSKIDSVILGLLSAEGSSINLINRVRKSKPDIDLILYTILESPFVIACLLDFGVQKIVHKRTSGFDLMKQILLLNKGKYNKIGALTQKSISKELILNAREILLVNYLAKGYSAEKIAQKLNRSIHTINNQKNELLNRFSCSNSNELVAKMIGLGYVKI